MILNSTDAMKKLKKVRLNATEHNFDIVYRPRVEYHVLDGLLQLVATSIDCIYINEYTFVMAVITFAQQPLNNTIDATAQLTYNY